MSNFPLFVAYSMFECTLRDIQFPDLHFRFDFCNKYQFGYQVSEFDSVNQNHILWLYLIKNNISITIYNH